MASIRVLSAAELGAIRFASASASKLWPVEVRFRESSASFSTAPSDALVARVIPAGRPLSTSPLVRAARGEWRAVVDVPLGPLEYAIMRGNTTVEQPVSFTVEPPDPPFENTRLASGLKASAPSGATQVSHPADANGLWKVRFVYSEPVFSVRDVYVEPFVEGAEDDDPSPVKCERREDEAGKTFFSAVHSLPSGVCRYRFRVVYSEVTAPEAAPFTRLGFDAGPSGSGARGLFTWELFITVNDLTTGDRVGESIMSHRKGGSLLDCPNDIVSSKKDTDDFLDVSSGCASVRNVAVALDEKSSMSATGMSVQGIGKPANGERQPGRPVKDMVARHEASAATDSRNNDESICKGSRVALLPGAVCVALLSAAFAVCIFMTRADRSEDDDSVDDSSDRRPATTSGGSGYLKHATSQGL